MTPASIRCTGQGTAENPFRLIDVSSHFEAVRLEYVVLSKLFGKRNTDWKLIRQSLVQNSQGRMCDILLIALKDSTQKEVWFDITEYLAKLNQDLT